MVGSDSEEEEDRRVGADGDELAPIDDVGDIVSRESPITSSGVSGEFGRWEEHTRGVAGRLMASMGYRPGTGLGRRRDGRVSPVPVITAPAGLSLDAVMEHRRAVAAGELQPDGDKVGRPAEADGIGLIVRAATRHWLAGALYIGYLAGCWLPGRSSAGSHSLALTRLTCSDSL